MKTKTKLHHKILNDKSVAREKHHRNIEREYEELKREVEQLKHRQGADKVYHTKRLHRKAHKLHAKAIKHEHPTLINKIGNYVGAMGTALKKGYQGYKKDYDAKQLQNKIEKDKRQSEADAERKRDAEEQSKKTDYTELGIDRVK